MQIQDIVKTVKKLVRKYKTHDPYELAKCLNIIILKLPLGTLNGYYTKAYRQKFIVLNNDLSDEQERFTLSHEIGHAVLHPSTSTPFFKSTYLSVNKLEIEANRFALELLIPDEMILQNSMYTTEQLSKLLGINQRMIELKIDNMKY